MKPEPLYQRWFYVEDLAYLNVGGINHFSTLKQPFNRYETAFAFAICDIFTNVFRDIKLNKKLHQQLFSCIFTVSVTSRLHVY